MVRKKVGRRCLKTIIKVEQEVIQETSQLSADDVLRAKAKIFSDPVVLLHRLTDKFIRKYKLYVQRNDSVKIFAFRGNEEKGFKDPHTCCLCQNVFSNRIMLWEHLERDHFKTKRFECDLCPKFFFTKNGINMHVVCHIKGRFSCDVCDFKTSATKTLECHKLTHDKVECPICHRKVAQLEPHMETHEPKVSCPICKKMYSKRRLNQHKKTHATKKCQKCNETFQDHEELRRHNLKKHFTGRLFECHCGAVYKRKEVLDNHKLVHNEDKVVSCEVCGRKFSSILSLKCHRRRKHGAAREQMKAIKSNGPFICDKCGSTHPKRKSFILHIFKQHQKTSIHCDMCPQSFVSKRFVVAHMEKEHLKLRPFKCEVCSYDAVTKGNLTTHMQQHGLKTLCKICNKVVTCLKEHLKAHVEATCPICSVVVKKKYLNEHTRRVHAKVKQSFIKTKK